MRLIVELTPYERHVLKVVLGDPCEARFLWLEHILGRINANLALYTSRLQPSKEGCQVEIRGRLDYWRSHILPWCRDRSAKDDVECARIITERLGTFITYLYYFIA